ncbi:MAG: thymidine kinase [Bacteroidales bacterium]|nr:thymidine kinase [Bacteroidales bacterium]
MNNINEHRKSGSIEVICGSMFSGKTEELIRRIRRATIARQSVEIFKPIIDVRYSEKDVVSHNKLAHKAVPVENSYSILLMSQGIDVIAIDEAQFFDEGIIDVCNKLANQGVRVIVAGLDMDFLGNPFGPMPQLLAIADEVYKTRAVCVSCGNLANYSFRIAEGNKQVMLGEMQEYQPLCRNCYQDMMAKKESN